MENKSFEGHPIKRIVDADTFVSYLVGYRSSVVSTRPSGWKRHLDLYARVKPDRPRITVSLEAVAWQDTPQSLQKALSLQYPSASVNEEKTVSLTLDIPNGRLFFELKSASVVSGFRADTPDGKYRSYDKYGRVVIPDHGQALLLRGTKLAPKGDWVISKRSANSSELKFINSGMAEKKYGEIEEEKLMKAMAKMSGKPVAKEEIFTKPATLQELQDIAIILERGKVTAQWRESLAP